MANIPPGRSLCDDIDVHKNTEEFFNHQLEHMHCSCSAVREEALNLAGQSKQLFIMCRGAPQNQC